MDAIFGSNWKTSVLSLIAGVALYFQQVGVTFPTTGAEWGTALVSALIFAWGRVGKDHDQTGVAKV
jgi:hypothetical protein